MQSHGPKARENEPTGGFPKPPLSFTRTQAMDGCLVDYFSSGEKYSEIQVCDQEEANNIANDLNPGFATALRECIQHLSSKRYDVELKYIENGLSEEFKSVAFIITAKNSAKNTYGIPNFNFLYEQSGRLGFESLNDQRKRVLTSENTGKDFSFDSAIVEIESFKEPVRVVLTPGTEAEKPFDFHVQYTQGSFNEGMERLLKCIKGNMRSYCHLFHDVLREQLQKDIQEASKMFIGSMAEPEIDPSRSTLNSSGLIAIKADIGSGQRYFRYKIAASDYDKPFPIIEKSEPNQKT